MAQPDLTESNFLKAIKLTARNLDKDLTREEIEEGYTRLIDCPEAFGENEIRISDVIEGAYLLGLKSAPSTNQSP